MPSTIHFWQRPLVMISLLTGVGLVSAADVRLERLADFDPAQNTLAVNLELQVGGPCRPDSRQLATAYEQMLELMGFRLAPVKDSDLEFAVFIAGFSTSGSQQCGLKLLSMVRQVPTMRILRLPPGSDSRQYRLWEAERLVTGTASELPALLREQARQDVLDFCRVFVEAQ